MNTRWDLIRMEKMTWMDFAQKTDSFIILPVGSMEQHGPHLPLNADSVIAENFSFRLAEELDAVVAPTLKYGYKSKPLSGGGPLFPGTIDLSGLTLQTNIMELIDEFYKDGFRKIFILNAHFENEAFIVEALDIASSKYGDDLLLITSNWWDPLPQETIDAVFDQIPFPGWALEHAAVTETSLMMYFAPDLVHEERMVDTKGAIPCCYIKYPIEKDAIPGTGVLATAYSSSAEKGEILSDAVLKRLIDILTPYCS